MHTRVDLTLRSEARRYELRFTCEHCVHFASEAGRNPAATRDGCETDQASSVEAQCSLGYPLWPHHRIDLERVESVTFCKAFELD